MQSAISSQAPPVPLWPIQVPLMHTRPLMQLLLSEHDVPALPFNWQVLLIHSCPAAPIAWLQSGLSSQRAPVAPDTAQVRLGVVGMQRGAVL